MPDDHETTPEPNGAATLLAEDDEALDMLDEEEDLAEELLDEEPDPDDVAATFEPDLELEPDLPFEPDEIDAFVPGGAATTFGADTATSDRLARLEAAARALADAQVTRENQRVRRKVTAATTGAGAVGFIPILLQLLGAFDLSPELTATLSTVAAIVGAFAAGWVTPERPAPLPAPVVADLMT